MEDNIIKEMAAEAALPITKKIGTIQLIGLISIPISPFILIWGSWQLSGKIALTGALIMILMWFTHKVTLNVFEAVTKEKLKENENKSKMKKSRW